MTQRVIATTQGSVIARGKDLLKRIEMLIKVCEDGVRQGAEAGGVCSLKPETSQQ